MLAPASRFSRTQAGAAMAALEAYFLKEGHVLDFDEAEKNLPPHRLKDTWVYIEPKFDVNYRALFGIHIPILQRSGFLESAQYGKGIICTLKDNADAARVTQTTTHFRMPNIPTLLSLTPEDFHKFLILMGTCKRNPSTLQFDMQAVNLPSIESHYMLSQIFETAVSNYRLRTEILTSHWVPFARMKEIADQNPPPTAETQLAALQYMNLDSSSFKFLPVDPLLSLGVDVSELKQATNDYFFRKEQ